MPNSRTALALAVSFTTRTWEAGGSVVFFSSMAFPLPVEQAEEQRDRQPESGAVGIHEGRAFFFERHVRLLVAGREDQPERAVRVGFLIHGVPSANGQAGPVLIPERGQQDSIEPAIRNCEMGATP